MMNAGRYLPVCVTVCVLCVDVCCRMRQMLYSPRGSIKQQRRSPSPWFLFPMGMTSPHSLNWTPRRCRGQTAWYPGQSDAHSTYGHKNQFWRRLDLTEIKTLTWYWSLHLTSETPMWDYGTCAPTPGLQAPTFPSMQRRNVQLCWRSAHPTLLTQMCE